MKYLIKVTQELLDEGHPFWNNKGCTIFHALKRAGLPVRGVGNTFWSDMNGKFHNLPPELIVGTSDNYRQDNLTGWAHPFEFEVEL